MMIGGQFNQSASQVAVTGQARSVAIRSGVTLNAPEVLVAAASVAAASGRGRCDPRYTVVRIRQRECQRDRALPGLVGGLLAVSNQRLNLITGTTEVAAGPVAIDIGDARMRATARPGWCPMAASR
jgi:hypothetical protein